MTVERGADVERLPAYLTRFVGRHAEIETVLDLLDRHPVVTLCGVGGVGKTRLVIEVAKRVRASVHGATSPEVCWVALGGARDATEVEAAVTAALRVFAPTGETTAALVNALGDRRVLLVLDSCEQVASACRALVDDLVSRCPRLRVLTTSRAPLQQAAEHVVGVPPLEEAVDLFLDRAALVAPAWVVTGREAQAVQEICRLLHSVPLAVELAASWVRVLSPADLLAELRQTGEVLTSSSAPVADRHRNMSIVLETSWRWLGEADQTILAALSLFVGGFTPEGAAEVAGATLGSLATLTERSLIQRLPDASGGSRYLMHDVVGSHARRYLQDADATRARHLAHVLSIVERRVTAGRTPAELTWSHPIGAELGNVGVALQWALDQGETEHALRLTVGLCTFGPYSTPNVAAQLLLLERALALPWSSTTPRGIRARADALESAGACHFQLGHHTEQVRDLFEESGRMFASIGDQARAAGSLRNHGWLLMILGDLGRGRRELRESLATCRGLGDRQGEAWSIFYLGQAELTAGNVTAARRHCREALEMFESLDATWAAFVCRVALVVACRRAADRAAAVDVAGAALQDWRTRRFSCGVTDLLDGLALVAVDLHQLEAAAELMGAAEGWRDAYGETSEAYDKQWCARGAAEVRTRLGEQRWTAARARGAQWPTDTLIDRVAEVIGVLATVLRARPSGLTPREIEVLQLVVDGRSNADIAEQLVVSRRTVHAHLRSIFAKLGVDNRTAAARKAVDLLPRLATTG